MPTTGELLSWIRAATRAPSTHNTQPWLFEIDGDEVVVRLDPRRSLPTTDPDLREQWMSLGCAVENMVVAARHDGEALEVSQPPELLGAERGVVVRARRDRTAPDGLYQAIVDRRTNRSVYDGLPLEPAIVDAISNVTLSPGVSVQLLTDKSHFDAYAELAHDATLQRYSSFRVRRELLTWMRFGDKQIASTLDGLSSNVLSEHPLPRWLGRASFALAMIPSRRAATEAARVRSSSALLLLSSDDDSPAAWLASGRSLERLLLHLTLLGVQHAYVTESIRVPELRVKLARLAQLEGTRPQVLLRLGHAPPLPRSPRRPLEEVVFVRREEGASPFDPPVPGFSSRVFPGR